MMINFRRAAEALRDELGPWLDDDYVPGKTQLRDALWARFDLSQLEAEELVDSLERAEVIRFSRSPEDGSGWTIAPSAAPDALE